MSKYNLKSQRETYILTIENDIVLKAGRKDEETRYFNQLGAGRRKLFQKLWHHLAFRIFVNLALPLVMIALDIIYPIKYTFALICHKKTTYPLRRLYLHHERRLLALSKFIDMQRDDDVWFHNSFDLMTVPGSYKSVCPLDFITIEEIWKSACQAVILHCKVVHMFGYDKYLLSMRAYEWCLTDFALRHVPSDVKMTYSSICDRMAILYDRLPHKHKTMIQHGSMHFHNLIFDSVNYVWHDDLHAYIWKSLYRSSPSTVYCYTKDDEIALASSVIANTPEYIHMGYGFKPSYKPEKKSVLIVGNPSLFFEKEKHIIQKLQGLNILVYLKNHPAESKMLYETLMHECSFIFIEGLDTRLPDVDLLISYDSTLAFEYASIGTKVLYYGHFDINTIEDIVKGELGC